MGAVDGDIAVYVAVCLFVCLFCFVFVLHVLVLCCCIDSSFEGVCGVRAMVLCFLLSLL